MRPESAGGGGAIPTAPLLLDFLPRTKVGRRVGRWDRRHCVLGRDPWGRAVPALAFLDPFLGPRGGAWMAGRAARASRFLFLSLGAQGQGPSPPGWLDPF